MFEAENTLFVGRSGLIEIFCHVDACMNCHRNTATVTKMLWQWLDNVWMWDVGNWKGNLYCLIYLTNNYLTKLFCCINQCDKMCDIWQNGIRWMDGWMDGAFLAIELNYRWIYYDCLKSLPWFRQNSIVFQGGCIEMKWICWHVSVVVSSGLHYYQNYKKNWNELSFKFLQSIHVSGKV